MTKTEWINRCARRMQKLGGQPSPDLLRLATALVERCAAIADKHESPDPREVGADIRAQFGIQ